MASRGKLTGGIGWREVVLNKSPRGIGDRCAIWLAQNAESLATWRIQVYAMTDQGSMIVGAFHTKQIGLANELPSRMVASATVPGAIGWKISAHCEDPREVADAWLSSSQQGGQGEVGISVSRTGTDNPTSLLTDTWQDIQAASGALANRGDTVWKISGTLDQSATGPDTFLLAFDQPTPPALGDVPIWNVHLGFAGVGGVDPSIYEYNFLRGYPVRSIFWMATSITPDTYTPNPANSVSLRLVVSTPG